MIEYKRNVDGSVFCEIQTCSHANGMGDKKGLLRGGSCIVVCMTVAELRSHSVQRSEMQIV